MVILNPEQILNLETETRLGIDLTQSLKNTPNEAWKQSHPLRHDEAENLLLCSGKLTVKQLRRL
jgi:hypothetical protein